MIEAEHADRLGVSLRLPAADGVLDLAVQRVTALGLRHLRVRVTHETCVADVPRLRRQMTRLGAVAELLVSVELGGAETPPAWLAVLLQSLIGVATHVEVACHGRAVQAAGRMVRGAGLVSVLAASIDGEDAARRTDGTLDAFDAVGLRSSGWQSDVEYPLNWTVSMEAWAASGKPVWITKAGRPVRHHDEGAQVAAFAAVMGLPAARVYWHCLADGAFGTFGLFDKDGNARLLARLLGDGLGGVTRLQAAMQQMRMPAVTGLRPVLVTGGAGFIGANLVDRLAADGHPVLVYDALARAGVERNLHWLARRHPKRVSFELGDLRDEAALTEAAGSAEAVFHLAGQVAVTTSMVQPLADFEVNARGTLALLEALRQHNPAAPLVFASTNKVYGDLADIDLARDGESYLPADPSLRARGVSEQRPLCFHTPYGCSKGAADQYVLDYAHSFGLRTAVLRMSCIYGERQLGTEDQGWVAHFLLRAIAGAALTIYGDGRQVRDVLHVGDAVVAYLAAWARIGQVAGRAYNLGGGPANAISLLQLVGHIEDLLGRRVEVGFSAWRPGDQRYFVADTGAAQRDLGLGPALGWREGVARLAGHFGAVPATAAAAQ